tara:strand:+ start:116 stop:487 length:372 start_codon:yes stop_codon:yes gene_type:complete
MGERKTRKLTCIVTGRNLLATKDYYERKVQKIGSEKKLHSTYICKEAKNLLLKGYSVSKIRELLNVNVDGLKEIPNDTVNEILNANKTRFRRINNIVTSSNIIGNETDPEVKQFLKNITNYGR